MIFLSQDPVRAEQARTIINEELAKETLSIVGWREVPVNPQVLGPIATESLPQIEQVFVNAPAGWKPRDVDRRLYIARRRIEKRISDDPDFYICSLSTQVTVYKGLCMPADLPKFYLDLGDLRWSRRSACSTSVSRPTPSLAGRWHNRFVTSPTTARSTPLPVTASGHGPEPISFPLHYCRIYTL